MATAPITDAAGPRAPRVAVIIVNYRSPDLALRCLEALEPARAALSGLSAVLVDGGSGDGSAERLADALATRNWPWVELLALPVNGGFGYANNQALLRLARRKASPDYVCLLNPDAAPRPSAIERLVALLEAQPRAAAAGAQLESAAGDWQGSAFTFPTPAQELSRGANTELVRRLTGSPPIALSPPLPAPVPWVTGAAVLLRVAALEQVGLFDDGFFLYFEEVELMHRLARRGWEIWHDPGARVAHVGGVATDIRWDEAGFHKPMPLPAYWYRSRRRYFVRTAGAPRAMLATTLFLLGRALWLTRCLLQRRRDRFPRATSRDMLRHSFWPSRADRAPRAIPRFGDPLDAPPAWTQA